MERPELSNVSPYKIVGKPWGREVWLEVNYRYATKILEIEPGKQLSLQYHKNKHETWYVLEGKPKVTHGSTCFSAKKGSWFVIPPFTKHRVSAGGFTRIFEASTTELDDVVRLKDDYRRK
jgi:mannose-1-phosphate guanylyltransferase/mannose-6-phosphate isomerase